MNSDVYFLTKVFIHLKGCLLNNNFKKKYKGNVAFWLDFREIRARGLPHTWTIFMSSSVTCSMGSQPNLLSPFSKLENNQDRKVSAAYLNQLRNFIKIECKVPEYFNTVLDIESLVSKIKAFLCNCEIYIIFQFWVTFVLSLHLWQFTSYFFTISFGIST